MLNRHLPVLSGEITRFVRGLPVRVFIDATLGCGGHARCLLEEALPPESLYVGFDRDGELLKETMKSLEAYHSRMRFCHANFRNMDSECRRIGIDRAEGVLMDLGVASPHLDEAARGFSLREDAYLDMRLDVRSELTAFDVVNHYDEGELERVFRDYSDAPRPRRIVRRILERRRKAPIRTTRELASLFDSPRETRGRVSRRIHPATTVFQAIRIEVNDELNALTEGLTRAFSLLASGGRLLVISFHSLEDRIVKRFFRARAASCLCPSEWPQCRCDRVPEAKILTPKPLKPCDREREENPRSRSARLRVLEKMK